MCLYAMSVRTLQACVLPKQLNVVNFYVVTQHGRRMQVWHRLQLIQDWCFGLIMVALCKQEDYYKFALWFRSFFFFLSFFSSPNLSGRSLDVYRTSTHGVALVRIFRMHVWNVLHAARWEHRTQKIAILAPSHNFVGLYLRSWGVHRQSQKRLLNNDTSSTCPHNMVNFGLLTVETLGEFGTPLLISTAINH